MSVSEDLLVATRKGLFLVDTAAPGEAPHCLGFLGDPVTAVLHDPRDGTLYAALNLGHFGAKLHRSDDFGGTWTELPHPAFATGEGDAPADGDAPSVSFTWTLEAGGKDQPGRLWAGTLPGALFRSDDRGESWQLAEALWNQPSRADWFGGGYDEPGIHSVLVDPRDSDKLTVGISCGGVWLSDDDGASWQLGGEGLAADYMPPDRVDDPSIQDPHRLAVSPKDPDVVWCQHHCGIFRSTDGGRSFSAIKEVKPSGFGFAVAAHPEDPDTAWFVPAVKDECRVPVDGRFVVTRTRNGGGSFESLSRGLPQVAAYDLVYRHAFTVDAETGRLAMGSTTGSLWLGVEDGESWSLCSANLPPINQVAFRAA